MHWTAAKLCFLTYAFHLVCWVFFKILAELTSKCQFSILDSCRFLTGLRMINVIRGSKYDINNNISALI